LLLKYIVLLIRLKDASINDKAFRSRLIIHFSKPTI
jgi:hypothetical protein